MKYYSATKKNENVSIPTAWMTCEYAESKAFNRPMNITKQKQIHGYREQTSGHQRGEGNGKR